MGMTSEKTKERSGLIHCIMALPLLIKSKAATIQEPNIPQGSPTPAPKNKLTIHDSMPCVKVKTQNQCYAHKMIQDL
jgi:hypothetical protein